MDTGSPACSGGLRTCEVVVGWVMSGAERSPPVGWIRVFFSESLGRADPSSGYTSRLQQACSV